MKVGLARGRGGRRIAEVTASPNGGWIFDLYEWRDGAWQHLEAPMDPVASTVEAINLAIKVSLNTE